jgi:hypothetical protein
LGAIEKYWLVVWNKETGDVLNATIEANTNQLEQVKEEFENNNKLYQVLDIGVGECPIEIKNLKSIN